MKNEIKFVLTGLLAGLACVAPGVSLSHTRMGRWSSFLCCCGCGIIITGERRHLQANLLQYLAGLAVCGITYLIALVAFIWVTGFSSESFGFRQSDFAKYEFGIDIGLGFLAAASCAAGGIAFFAFVLTGRWSNFLFGRLLLAGT